MKLLQKYTFDEINDYIKKYGKDEKIIRIEEEVIKSGSSSDILDFARNVKDANVNKLQKAIIKLGDPSYYYFFARDVKGANIELLQQKVIEHQAPWDIYIFARFIDKADKNKLQNEIVKLLDAESICAFAKFVSGADINKLQEAILKTGNKEYINDFAKNVVGADKNLIIDGYNKDQHNFVKNIKKFAKNALNLSVSKVKGFSKIGGNPTVPNGFVWPVNKEGVKIPFFMQLDFSQINNGSKLEKFPSKGLLYLFFDEEVINTNFPLRQGDHYQFLFYNDGKDLHIEELEIKKYDERYLKIKQIKMYPNDEEDDELFDYLAELDEDDRDLYYDKYHYIESDIGFVGGWPQILQSSYLNKDEMQLLQLNSVDNHYMFGDLGMLQFYIKDSDIKSLNFNNVKANLETT